MACTASKTRKLHWHGTSKNVTYILTLWNEWWGKHCCPPHIQPVRTKYICCNFIQQTHYFANVAVLHETFFQSNNQALCDNSNQINGTIHMDRFENLQDPERCMLARERPSVVLILLSLQSLTRVLITRGMFLMVCVTVALVLLVLCVCPGSRR